MRRDEHPSLRKFRDNLFFYCENQGCEYWMLQPRDMRLSDPPVFRTETDPRQVSPTLSAFAIQTLFREAIWRGPYRGWGGDFSISVIHEVQRSLSCSDLPELYWSAAEPIRFYEGRDIIMDTHGDAWIYIAALSEAACQSVPKVVRDAMEWDQR